MVHAATSVPGAVIAERYRIEAVLGTGGMGTVYRVHDAHRGCALALKQLRVPAGGAADLLLSQFEREYHTLIQLRHPSIIEVYDYGIDDSGLPFYTMELLAGTDLRGRAPLGWRPACALLRDVASSLAVLHSRRLLHRDISASNIHCTDAGRAKLIDFGAMAPMGVLKSLVGTPPFVPPEALQLQTLDGRADLYALGGVLYWVLTQRYPYPARRFEDLPDLWRTPLSSPRQLGAELPAALDELIIQLLRLDRSARPASAAEVIERLSGIAGLALGELPAVSAAYLTTPTLVGRDELRNEVRAHLLQARQGQGGSFLIEGAAGSGRSRALDACVLDAKLLGAVVLRGDAADSAGGDYGLLRSLAAQLLVALPTEARRCARPHRDVLAHVLPQLQAEFTLRTVKPADATRPDDGESAPPAMGVAPGRPSGPALDSLLPSGISPPPPPPAALDAGAPPAEPERRLLQSALRDFVMGVARDQHLVLAIDDADAVDEPSVGVLGMLGHAAKRRRLSLLLTAREPREGDPSGLALLRPIARRHTLAALHRTQTEALLQSVFGEVANLAAVSAQVFELAGGNPRWTMELAAHLVVHGVARYEAGSWALPATLRAGEIPAALSETLAASVSALPPDARALAEALALTEPTLIAVPDYVSLTEHGDRARTYVALEVLLASGVLVAAADRHRFRVRELAVPLREGLSAQRAQALHARIASVLERGQHLLQLAEHLLLGGREAEGIQCALRLCDDSLRPHYSPHLLRLIEHAASCARRMKAPPWMQAILRGRVLFLSAVLGDYARFCDLMPSLRDAVARETGLADYYELSEIADPAARLEQAQRRAQQRFEATPEAERGFAPLPASAGLALVWASCGIMAGIVQDLTLLDALPAAGAISPRLRYLDASLDIVRATQGGRFDDARRIAAHMLQMLDQPAGLALPPTDRERARSSYAYLLGLFAAVIGHPSALEYVKLLDRPHHRSNAWRVRMVFELMHGRAEAAAICQRRAELLSLQDSGTVALPGTTARAELLAAIHAGDVVAVKRGMERSQALAAGYPRWRPTWALARCHYRRLQGDAQAALEAADEALALVAPGRHFDWGPAMAAKVALLNHLGRSQEALELGTAALQTAERERLTGARNELLRCVAECYTRVGRLQDAARLADEHIAAQRAIGSEGLALGGAYETRARVAIAMRDEPGVVRYAQLCAEQYKGSGNPLISGKYQALIREAELAGIVIAGSLRDAAQDDVSVASEPSSAAQTLRSQLLADVGSDEGAARTLRLLLEMHGAATGYLFGAAGQALQLLASSEGDEPSAAVVSMVERCVARSLAVHAGGADVELQPVVSAAADIEDDEDLAQLTVVERRSELAAVEPAADPGADGFELVMLFASKRPQRAPVAIAALYYDTPARVRVSASALSAFADAILPRVRAGAAEDAEDSDALASDGDTGAARVQPTQSRSRS